MALAVTSLTSSSTAGASVASAVTASVSPSANALLILWVSAYNGAGTQTFTVNTVTGLSLTWTRQKLGTAGSASKGDVECWTAVCGASPGSGTVTAAFTTSFAGGAVWDLDQVTGQDAVTPVVTSNTISANNSSTAASATFATAASSSNLFVSGITGLIGSGGSQTLTGNESPAWTQLANTSSNTTGEPGVIICTQVSPDVTHLTTSAAVGSSGSWGVIGIEVAASSGGSSANAGDATGTGAADAATAGVGDNAGDATGTGAALAASAGPGVSAGDATGTGGGLSAFLGISVPGGVAGGDGAALPATVTSSGTAASAGLASGTGAAMGATAGLPAAVQRGSWWQLDSVLKERAEYASYYRSQTPVACPNDGTPLLQGPPQAAAVLYCPMGDWQYPRDYDPIVHSGM